MDNVPNTTTLHPLLVSGDKYAGSVFAKMMCEVVVSVKVKGVLIDRRTNRGFPDEILKAIAAGMKPVSIEAIRQLLHDFYSHAPMSVGRGDKDYVLLKSIAEGTWREREEQTFAVPSVYSAGFLEPTPAPASQLKVSEPHKAEAQTVRRSAIQAKAQVTAPPRVTPVVLPTAESTQSRPLPRIVVRQEPLTPVPQQVVKIPKNEPLPAQARPAPAVVPKPKKVLKPSPSFHTMMKKKPSIVPEKPVKQKVARGPGKPRKLRAVKPKEDLGEVVDQKRKFAVLDQEVTSRFWINLKDMLQAKECDIATLLAKIHMPLSFFLELKDAKQTLTTAQVMRVARGLGCSVDLLLR